MLIRGVLLACTSVSLLSGHPCFGQEPVIVVAPGKTRVLKRENRIVFLSLDGVEDQAMVQVDLQERAIRITALRIGKTTALVRYTASEDKKPGARRCQTQLELMVTVAERNT